MLEWIKQLNNKPVFLGIASLSSILGFVLSGILLLFSWNIKNKIKKYSDIKLFNKRRKSYRNKLIAYKDLITENDILDNRLVSDLNVEINNFDNFKINSWKDRLKTFLIKRHLKKDINNINKKKLCNQLSYFISRYNKEREKLI